MNRARITVDIDLLRHMLQLPAELRLVAATVSDRTPWTVDLIVEGERVPPTAPGDYCPSLLPGYTRHEDGRVLLTEIRGLTPAAPQP